MNLENMAENICNYIHVLHPASAQEAGRALKQYAIQVSKADEDKVTEMWYGVPEIYPVSMKDIEEAMRKCANTNK